MTPLHLPRSCLECVPWRDGGGETCAKVAQCSWLSSADGVKDGSGSESERRQAMQNDASETGLGTNTRICFGASEDGVRDTKEEQRWGKKGNEGGKERLHTDMKWVVITREAVDQCLLG